MVPQTASPEPQNRELSIQELPSIEIIEPMIDRSLALMKRRLAPADITHGLFAALRRLRAAIDDIGGATMVGVLDGAIRDRMVVRKMRSRCGAIDLPPAPLPAAATQPLLAEAIMVETADVCLVWAARQPDATALLLTVFVLLDRLVESIGGVPDFGLLLGQLRAEDEAIALAGESAFSAPAASVH